MAANLRFPSSPSTTGSSYSSGYSTSASSASSSSLLNSRPKLPPVIHTASSRRKDSDVRSKGSLVELYDTDYRSRNVDETVAVICSIYRDAEIIVFERIARSRRLGLPTDIPTLKLVLCFYRGRTEIQRWYDKTYVQRGSVFTEGDGGLFLKQTWQSR